MDISARNVIHNWLAILRNRLGFPFDEENTFVAKRTRPVRVNLNMKNISSNNNSFPDKWPEVDLQYSERWSALVEDLGEEGIMNYVESIKIGFLTFLDEAQYVLSLAIWEDQLVPFVLLQAEWLERVVLDEVQPGEGVITSHLLHSPSLIKPFIWTVTHYWTQSNDLAATCYL